MKAQNPYTGPQYRPGAAILASRIQKSRRVAKQTLARALRTTIKKAGFIVDVLYNPKQQSNRGSMQVAVPGGIRLKYLTLEQHAVVKAS
jgi:hypothetical protein